MRLFILIIMVVLLISCNRSIDKEVQIRKTLNSNLNLTMFDVIHTGNDTINFKKFRNKYSYLSVVYLIVGCKPCYSEFIKWYNHYVEIDENIHYTVVFIIQGYSYESFIKELKKVMIIEKEPNIIMDPYFKYIENNRFPLWILKRSVLIDKNNSIKLIGDPFISPLTKSFFYSIINKD